MTLRFKALFLVLVSYFSVLGAFGQIEDPVDWTWEAFKIDDSEYLLVFNTEIEDHWHIYSQNLESLDGPIPTSFSFEKSSDWSKIGVVEECNAIDIFDPVFDMQLQYFENSTNFGQKIKLSNPDFKEIKGYLSFMVCDDEKCLPPDDIDFVFDLSSAKELPAETEMCNLKFEKSTDSGFLEPVKWSFRAEDLGDGKFEIFADATIEKSWHVYALDLPFGGPLPSEFYINDSTHVTTLGEPKEPEYITHYDPNFDMDLNYFENSLSFSQVISSNDQSKPVEGYVYFMVCDDEKCLPPEQIDFQVDLNTRTGKVKVIMPDNASGDTKFNYLTPSIDLSNPVNGECEDVEVREVKEDEKGLLTIFLLGLGGGLLALLTPCVFPMIPLTVSFFTKGSEDKKRGTQRAVTYGLFIFLIYLLLSLPFHLLDQVNENILNDISTNVILNIAFFVVFVFFAFSFFGFYELTLPASLANKMDSASNKGGLIGIFFMALTLAIVSFSCTGPILGSLLAGSMSSDGGAMQLTAGMAGFGVALGVPFALFAAFPRLLNSLPQSGGWLNSVKVILGFLELALALKFLSNADLVDHWGFLKYELFMGLWIIIFALMGLYLLGKIKFPHDSPLNKISATRIVLALIFFGFAGYLCTGFRYDEKAHTYKSLSLLSGLAPPAGYCWIYPVECPQNLDCEHDYLAALERAKAENKPIFVDFTGYACVNCRKMEEHVWPEDGILNLLDEEYIVVSLYVDDKMELPEEQKEVFTSQKTGKTKSIESYGDKWSAFQIETYGVNSQPYYALISPDEKLLNKPVPYTPDANQYRNWLECGLDAWNKNK